MANTDLIGADLGEQTIPVETGKIREFARALFDRSPELCDPDHPRGNLAPAIHTQITAFYDAPPESYVDLGLDYAFVLHGEQEYEFVRPVRAGDTLTGHTKIADIYEKPGKRGGTMTFVVFETHWRNQDGQECTVARMTLVEAEAASLARKAQAEAEGAQ